MISLSGFGSNVSEKSNSSSFHVGLSPKSDIHRDYHLPLKLWCLPIQLGATTTILLR